MADEEITDTPKKLSLQDQLDAISTEKNPKAREGTIISQKLTVPITTGGETIEFLDYRKPGVKELRKYGATGEVDIKKHTLKFDMDVIALYVEKLCALSRDDANKIDLEDFAVCKEIILVFFPLL